GIFGEVVLHFVLLRAIFEAVGFHSHEGYLHGRFQRMCEAAQFLHERENLGDIGLRKMELERLIVVQRLFVLGVPVTLDREFDKRRHATRKRFGVNQTGPIRRQQRQNGKRKHPLHARAFSSLRCMARRVAWHMATARASHASSEITGWSKRSSDAIIIWT